MRRIPKGKRRASRDGVANSRFSAFAFFVVLGLAVFLPLITFSNLIPDGPELIFRIVLAAVLLGLFLMLRNSATFGDLAVLFLAFAVAVIAMTLSWRYGNVLFDAYHGDLQTMRGIALAKAGSAGAIVVPILVFFPLLSRAGADLYLAWTPRAFVGVLIGIAAFVGFALLAFGGSFSEESNLQNLQAAAPWILVFVFANALSEEILFRSLFLSTARRMMGGHLAVLATAAVFTITHVAITYASEMAVFLASVFVLSLIWASLMIWSRNLWGSVIFHAGADLLVIGGVLQSLQ